MMHNTLNIDLAAPELAPDEQASPPPAFDTPPPPPPPPASQSPEPAPPACAQPPPPRPNASAPQYRVPPTPTSKEESTISAPPKRPKASVEDASASEEETTNAAPPKRPKRHVEVATARQQARPAHHPPLEAIPRASSSAKSSGNPYEDSDSEGEEVFTRPGVASVWDLPARLGDCARPNVLDPPHIWRQYFSASIAATQVARWLPLDWNISPTTAYYWVSGWLAFERSRPPLWRNTTYGEDLDYHSWKTYHNVIVLITLHPFLYDRLCQIWSVTPPPTVAKTALEFIIPDAAWTFLARPVNAGDVVRFLANHGYPSRLRDGAAAVIRQINVLIPNVEWLDAEILRWTSSLNPEALPPFDQLHSQISELFQPHARSQIPSPPPPTREPPPVRETSSPPPPPPPPPETPPCPPVPTETALPPPLGSEHPPSEGESERPPSDVESQRGRACANEETEARDDSRASATEQDEESAAGSKRKRRDKGKSEVATKRPKTEKNKPKDRDVWNGKSARSKKGKGAGGRKGTGQKGKGAKGKGAKSKRMGNQSDEEMGDHDLAELFDGSVTELESEGSGSEHEGIAAIFWTLGDLRVERVQVQDGAHETISGTPDSCIRQSRIEPTLDVWLWPAPLSRDGEGPVRYVVRFPPGRDVSNAGETAECGLTWYR